MLPLKMIVEKTYQNINEINSETIDKASKSAILEVIGLLDKGKLRVAEKIDKEWIVHEWLKQAILLSFRIHTNKLFDATYTHYFDKIPLKYAHYNASDFQKDGSPRIVPNACVRQVLTLLKILFLCLHLLI